MTSFSHRFLILMALFSLNLLVCAGCSLIGSSSSESDGGEEKAVESDNSKKEETDSDDDGFGSDFNEMELLAEALRSYDQERYSVTRSLLEKLVRKYPASPLVVFSELKIADATYYSGKHAESIPLYKEFVQVHSSNPARPYAMYQIAEALLATYQGTGQDETPVREARKAFSKLKAEYEGKEFVWTANAAEQILECDRKLLASELEVIGFYLKTGQTGPAESRLKNARSTYGHLPDASEMINERFSEGFSEPVPVDSPSNKKIEAQPIQDLVKKEDTPPGNNNDLVPANNGQINSSNEMELLEASRSPVDTASPNNGVSSISEPVEGEPVLSSGFVSANSAPDPKPSQVPDKTELPSENESKIIPIEKGKDKDKTDQKADEKTDQMRLAEKQAKVTRDLASVEEQNESIEDIARKINNTNSPTLGSLEEKNDQQTSDEVSKLSIENKQASRNIAIDKERLLEADNITGSVSGKPEHFLLRYSCDSTEDQSRLVLHFNKKPFLRTSKSENLPSGSIVSGGTTERLLGSHISTVLIQNVFSAGDIDFDPADDGTTKNWVVSKLANCGSSLDRVLIQEYMRLASETDSTNTDVLVRVQVVSKRPVKLNLISAKDPERFILTFRPN